MRSLLIALLCTRVNANYDAVLQQIPAHHNHEYTIQYYQEFLSLAQQKADEAKQLADVEASQKAEADYQKKLDAETQKELKQPQAIQQLYSDLIEAFRAGLAPTMEDAMTNALQYYGIELSQDQVYAIFQSAMKNAGIE